MKIPTFFKSRGCAALSLATAVALGAAACSSGEAEGKTEAPATKAAPPGIPVTTATVERQSMPLAINVVGTAEAYSSVSVRAQITGALTSVGFNEGDDVTKGQVLFSLDRRPLEAALQQAQATLARDTLQAANAQSTAERYQNLRARGLTTPEQADQSRTTAAALDATLQADRAAVQNATVQLEYSTIMAPLSGRTGALIVHEGNLVRANDTTPLVVINQVSPIYVSFGVPEDRLLDVKQYQARGTIRVEAAPSGTQTATSTGRITFIDNAVDSTTGQIRMKAEFPNADRRLWPGQFADLNIVLAMSDGLVVPASAVQNGQEGTYVFVVKPDMTVDLRPVTIDRQVNNVMVVRTGVTPDEIVVTDGQLRLVKGARVSVKSAAAANTATQQ